MKDRFVWFIILSAVINSSCAGLLAQEPSTGKGESSNTDQSTRSQTSALLYQDVTQLKSCIDRHGFFSLSELVDAIDRRQLAAEAELDFDVVVNGALVPLPVERKPDYVYFFVSFNLGNTWTGGMLFEAKIDDELFEAPPTKYQRMLATTLAFYNPNHKSTPIEIHRMWKYPWKAKHSQKASVGD